MTDMDKNLQHVYNLVSFGAHPSYEATARICRQLCTSKTPAAKAHAITGILAKLPDHEQALILDAMESLPLSPQDPETVEGETPEA
jgi:hypothetical protein